LHLSAHSRNARVSLFGEGSRCDDDVQVLTVGAVSWCVRSSFVRGATGLG